MRIQWRLIRRTMMAYQSQKSGAHQRVLIYGAGMAGSLVANEYKRNPHIGKKVVGFIDDDQEKLGTVIGTLPVLGSREELETIVKNYDIDEIIKFMMVPPMNASVPKVKSSIPANVQILWYCFIIH